jgi:hypothetical protein
MNTKRAYCNLRVAIFAAVAILPLAISGGSAAQDSLPQGGAIIGASFDDGGGCRAWEYGNPDLFYNFYSPNNCGGNAAAMYIAPRPVPAVVGHTYYTYQPMMPHEFTYPHYRTYRRYYDDGRGMTRTKAVWYSNPLTVALKGVREAVRLPR